MHPSHHELPADARPIPDLPNHWATPDGKIIYKKVGGGFEEKFQKQHKKGYMEIGVRCGGRKRKWLKVHRLILIAFVGYPPAGTEACHRDGHPSHNSLTNLYWGTKSRNGLDKVEHGRSRQLVKFTQEQVEQMRQMAANGVQRKEISRQFTVSLPHLCHILKNDVRNTDGKRSDDLRTRTMRSRHYKNDGYPR